MGLRGGLGGARIRLNADPPQKLVLDGEIVGTTPAALQVLIDQDPAAT